MKHTDEFLSIFDQSWDTFAKSLKKARKHASEESIHDLRVSVRRVIAILDLMTHSEAQVGHTVRQEPAASVVKAGNHSGAAGEAERGVLGDPERRGQVVEQGERIPHLGAKLACQS